MQPPLELQTAAAFTRNYLSHVLELEARQGKARHGKAKQGKARRAQGIYANAYVFCFLLATHV